MDERRERIEEEMRKQDYGIVCGGQGKSSRETEDSGFWFGMCVVMFFLILLVAICAAKMDEERDQPQVRFVPNAERY